MSVDKKLRQFLLVVGATYLLWSWIPLLVVFSLLLYAYFTRNNDYWRKRGVPYLTPTPVLGNLNELLHVRVSPGQFLANIYHEASGKQFVGYFIFDRPSILIRDTELIKNILVKDFDYFPARHTESHYSVDPIGSRNLFVVRGERWRQARVNLSPAFTSGKLRHLFQLMSQKSVELCEYFKELSADPGRTVKIRDTIARYATDVVSISMFGIESNTLRRPDAEFRRYGKKVFGFTKYRGIEILGMFFAPALAKLGRFKFFQKETTAFFRKVFGEAMEYRLKKGIQRNDLLDKIIRLANITEGSYKRTNGVELEDETPKPQLADQQDPQKDSLFRDEDLIAHSAIFFSAGFESTSITISFSLYELAVNPHIQTKLREEIDRIMEEHDGQLTYDAVFQMKYLDMVVSESLRMYPPLLHLDRICHKDYNIQGTDVTIEKGTSVYISIMGIHRDAQYYPDPLRFDPERFTESNKKSRPNYCYLPFGQGPHNCIGMRFGLLSAKVTLIHILSRFKVVPSEETPMPLELSPFGLFLGCVGGLPLAFKHNTRACSL